MKQISLLVIILILFNSYSLIHLHSQTKPSFNTEYINGKWFNGNAFEAKTVYSVNGQLSFKKPKHIGKTIDLSSTWIVPPFADAHNHNLGTGVKEWEKKAIDKYVTDGVFYVKIQGSLPITEERKKSLFINDKVDVVFAHGTLTASGGFPIFLLEKTLLPQGYFPGHTSETLKDYRYYTIDSEHELDQKWASIQAHKPDFIKVFLWFSDEFEKRRVIPNLPFKGLDPNLIPYIVTKAHGSNLRVSCHVSNAADFANAVRAGVDEINHLPFLDKNPISPGDAQLAAQKGIVVITTCSLIETLPRAVVSEEDLPIIKQTQILNLRTLVDNGVKLAIGSDNVNDASLKEVFYLNNLGIFDNLTLLKMWTETTPKAIYPQRKIGKLEEGYEANFLALEGNPLDDLNNVRKIRYRFKNGSLLNLE